MDGPHLGLVGGPTTLRIGTMAIAVLGVGVLDGDQGLGGGRVVVLFQVLADGGILAGDVFLEEGAERLAGEIKGHLDEALGGRFFLALATALAVVSRRRD